MDLKEIKELIAYLEGTAFAEVEVEGGDVRVKVVRQAPPAVMSHAPAAPAAPAAQTGHAGQPEARTGGYEVRIPPPSEPGRVITSPIVGTFYRSPAPDKPPYVEVGSVIKKGQVICIVEAMKLMNEIESELEGKVAAFLVDDGEPVEFGQPLMRIEG
jgi:acetyl-CoA carboxylase biotin carboxyl carrier protein